MDGTFICQWRGGRERTDQRRIIEFSYLIAQVFSQHPRSVLNEVFRDEFIWKVQVFHKKSPWRICSWTIPFIREIALAFATLPWLYTGWKFWDSLKEQCRLKTLICYPRLHSNVEKNRCPDINGESQSILPGSGFVSEPLFFCISLQGLPYQSATDWVGSPVVIYFCGGLEVWNQGGGSPSEGRISSRTLHFVISLWLLSGFQPHRPVSKLPFLCGHQSCWIRAKSSDLMSILFQWRLYLQIRHFLEYCRFGLQYVRLRAEKTHPVAVSLVKCPKEEHHTWGWPESSSRFFCTVFWKNLNGLLASPIEGMIQRL